MIKFFKSRYNVLFARIWPSLSALLLIPFIITSIVILYYNIDTINTKTKSQQENYLIQLKNKYDEIDTEVNTIYYTLQNDTYTLQYMAQTSIYDNLPITQSQLLAEIRRRLTYNISANSHMASIYLYNRVSDHCIGAKLFSGSEGFDHKNVYNKYIEKAAPENTQPIIISQKDSDTLIYCCPFKMRNGTLTGLLFINISTDAFTLDGIDEENTYCVTDSTNHVIYSNDNNFKYGNVYKDLHNEESENGIYSAKFRSTKYDILADDSGRLYILKRPVGLMYSELIKHAIPLVIYLVVVTILSLIIAYFTSSYLSKSITDIILSFDDDHDIHTQNSIKYLFNTMMHYTSIKDMSSVTPKLLMLRKSQAIALQTQLTPHFLYNTLNSINLMVMNYCTEDDSPSQMIHLFSQILKEALDTKTYLVSLEEELRISDKYVELQKIKYEGKFDVIYNIDEDTLSCSVVKLILQPLLENALHHGIFLEDKKGIIEISAKHSNNELVIKITNTGPEISAKKLKELRTILDNNRNLQESKHLGLANVSQRIKLVYGSEYGCSIESANEKTTVSLHLPFQEVPDEIEE